MLGVDIRTSEVVNGIRGQSYPTLGTELLWVATPVTLLWYPDYTTFTGKVILQLGKVQLTPSSSPSIGTARYRQTGA